MTTSNISINSAETERFIISFARIIWPVLLMGSHSVIP